MYTIMSPEFYMKEDIKLTNDNFIFSFIILILFASFLLAALMPSINC